MTKEVPIDKQVFMAMLMALPEWVRTHIWQCLDCRDRWYSTLSHAVTEEGIDLDDAFD